MNPSRDLCNRAPARPHGVAALIAATGGQTAAHAGPDGLWADRVEPEPARPGPAPGTARSGTAGQPALAVCTPHRPPAWRGRGQGTGHRPDLLRRHVGSRIAIRTHPGCRGLGRGNGHGICRNRPAHGRGQRPDARNDGDGLWPVGLCHASGGARGLGFGPACGASIRSRPRACPWPSSPHGRLSATWPPSNPERSC